MEEDPNDRARRKHRERQARYRKRKAEESAPNENQSKRLKHANDARVRRANESEQETKARLKQMAATARLRRAHETEQQHDQRLTSLYNSRRTAQEQISQMVRTASTNFDDSAISPHSCGLMNDICQYCCSRNFKDERPSDGLFTHCCRKGKVKLPKPVDINKNELKYPTFLQDLMSNPANPDYRTFREQIRSINNAVSFASMGADIVDVPGRGPFVFKIHGQSYHLISHLNPPANKTRKYAQLYVIDSTQALSIRNQQQANQNCPSRILDKIDRFFRENNRIAQTFHMIREVENRENIAAAAANQPPPQVSLVFRRDRRSDNRRYNNPTSNEIAMIFVNEDGEPPFERDIRIYPKNPENSQHQYVQLNILSSNLDPMTYSILYPFGEPGWQPKWQCDSYPGVQGNRVRNNISMLQFKVAQTAVRDEFNPVIHAGKLTQQWLVDSYLQVEANNLNYIRFNQKNLRTELYKGLMDHMENVAANQNVPAGIPVILPSSFSGSPRNMREQCCDAMSIFAKFGAPDLFITFTSNPTWTEITENLAQGETSSDRPDLVARVFKIKLDSLINDITVQGTFGKCLAYVYTIEFQKRGLPHAHIMVTLQQDHKFTTAEKIDSLVSAEIPSSETNPQLREIVIKNMMHGPCGVNNLYAPCMENRECKKKFPKSFNETTKTNVNGYPVYKRREGENAKVRGVWMDNRNVVPYNPFLLIKYNAHINVEVCTSLAAIKYIYKYIYKGFDCTNVAVTSEGGQQLQYDEISNFISCRYVCAPEATWRILEYKMHDRSHTVQRLPVHLPNQQRLYFEEGNEEEAILAAHSKLTKLESFFKLNETDELGRQLLYAEMPYNYVYKQNKWQRRQRGANNVVSRIYTVSPRDEERFYLRTLLLHVRGPTSYVDLRTHEGIIHSSFKAAAIAHGLLESDCEWIRCLEDAVTYQMPRQLRETFAYILHFGQPARPFELWEKFKNEFILDFASTNPEQIAANYALHAIETTLKDYGKNCAFYGLPIPQGDPPIENAAYDIGQEAYIAQINIEKLNEKQKEAFHRIINALDSVDQQPRCFYLDGPGGSGKTFLYSTLLAFVRGRDQIALPFATTGIAATLLKGGRTVHSGFKLPVPIDDTSVSLMRLASDDAKLLHNASLIIIDEITMLSKDGLRCIDLLLRDIMKSNNPFGGKVLIVGGDFRQTLPVVPRGNRADIVESCIKTSQLWRHFEHLKLTTNMRSEGQQEHNNWLLKVGEGIIPRVPSLSNPDLIRIPPQMIENGSLIDAIFGEHPAELNDEQLSNRTIVAATNVQVLEMNREIIGRLHGEPTIYYSADSVISEDPNDAINFTTEFLNGLTPSGMPPHTLLLKKGTIVMLLRNLNPKKGLCNGTRLIVEELSKNTIKARIITACNQGESVIIPRIVLQPSDTTLPFVLRRRQFPIIPAFCITINKSQGQTYNRVGIDLQVPVFTHGQLYVAFSRARDGRKIKVKISENQEQGRLLHDEQEFTRNVVFKEVFSACLVE